MDLRSYYQKIRDAEAGIPEQYAVIVSRDMPDGGKGGVMVEVTRHVAAKMVVEGSAQLATADQVTTFESERAAALKAAQDAAAAAKVEVTMVSSDDLKKLTDDVKKLKAGAKTGKE